jgi:hypothetical protein
MSDEPEVVSTYQVIVRLRGRMAEWKARAEQAEAELATLRGALEKARERIAAMPTREERIGGQRAWYVQVVDVLCIVDDAIHAPIFTATPPRRTPEGDDALDDAARNLFAALCEGDGKHSEALDRRIIASHLDAYARRTTPPRRPPEPECDSCGERHLPQVMCPPHEVRRGTRNTMAVKPQGEDT